MSGRPRSRRRRPPRLSRRAGQIVDLALYLTGLVAVVIVTNYFAQQPALRLKLDATKTRAYSLSQQTRQLLDALDGDWSIALVMIEDQTERPVQRQVDEVLRRFADSAPSLSVSRIDPTDPSALGAYEHLLARLRGIYADVIREYDYALDDAEAAFESLQIFAQRHAGGLQQLAGSLPGEGPQRETLAGRGQLMALLAGQGEAVLAEVASARSVDDARPLADYETARSILAEALREWSNQLYEVAKLLEQWLEQDTAGAIDAATRGAIRRIITDHEDEAVRLVGAEDPLRQLPPLELSSIGRNLQAGEAAIVMGPDRAAVIPSSQLFPRTNLKSGTGGAVTFDQRFRGEQLLASAIRSLQVGEMPMVVFMHVEPRSLARRHEGDVDLVGVWSLLKASRFDVREWRVGTTEPPLPRRNQPVVWVVVPKINPQGVTPGEDEMALVGATRQLIQQGQAVLLSVYPTERHKFGRRDPWTDVARPFGLAVETGSVVHEAHRVSEEETRVERGQIVRSYSGSHLLGAALQGQHTYLALPMAVRAVEEHASSVRHDVIARITAHPNRWLDGDLHRRPEQIHPPAEDRRLDEDLAVITAARRTDPASGKSQRAIVVGSGGWMLSMTADLAVNVAGERYALLYPGNNELMLSSVYWLAGLDDLIAPSAASREVDRLESLVDASRRRWFWASVVGMPGACLAAGFMVWYRRRS